MVNQYIEDRPFRQQLQESGRLAALAVRLAWRAGALFVVGIVALLVVQAALSPLQLVLTRAVIDRAAVDLGLLADAGPFIARLPLGAWIVLAVVAVAVGQLIQPFSATLQSQAGDRLTGYVTEQLIRAANRWQGLARFEDPALADDLARSRRNASESGLELTTSGAQAVLVVFTAVSLALVLGGLHPLLPLVLVLATLPQVARQWNFDDRMGSHLYAQTEEARQLLYLRDVTLTPASAKDVRLYALGPFFTQRHGDIFTRTMNLINQLRRGLVPPMALASALAALATGAVYVYVVWLVATGQRTPGDLALYGGAAALLQQRLQMLGLNLGYLPRALNFLPALYRVLEAPPDLPVPASPRSVPPSIREGITFERVAFTYPGRSEPVLHNLSLHLGQHESVALVGRNGAGKTTLVKLLLRLYDPTAGRILLDGVDLREFDPAELRQQMGVIFQDFMHYELTAGENIGLGQVEALSDSDRLHTAAASAGADTLLRQLPQGLDTQLGRQFGGRELSGGEWQKLALARAFVRDCSLLVLDEPTAALDVQTEYEVYQRFQELTRDRTTLLISHRFSTVRMADRILYLADGRIQEAGTHATLLTQDGAYARLYRLQAAQYAEQDDEAAGP